MPMMDDALVITQHVRMTSIFTYNLAPVRLGFFDEQKTWRRKL